MMTHPYPIPLKYIRIILQLGLSPKNAIDALNKCPKVDRVTEDDLFKILRKYAKESPYSMNIPHSQLILSEEMTDYEKDLALAYPCILYLLRYDKSFLYDFISDKKSICREQLEEILASEREDRPCYSDSFYRLTETEANDIRANYSAAHKLDIRVEEKSFAENFIWQRGLQLLKFWFEMNDLKW